MKYYLRLNSSVPEENRIPGNPLAWPVTRYELEDDAPAPEDPNVIGPLTEEAMLACYAASQAEFDAREPERAAWKAALALPGLKMLRNVEVDARSREVIGRGFEYAGVRLSMSPTAQLKLQGAYAARAALDYPQRWNNLDDSDFVYAHDPEDVEVIHHAMTRTLLQTLEVGTVLKERIRSAESAEELAAVVDER